MATQEHVDITDPYIHEPKGAAAASANTVYVASGSGTGTWEIVPTAALDLDALVTENQTNLDNGTLTVTGHQYLTGVIPDVSTASSILIPIIDDCTIVSARFVLYNAITVANASVNIANSAGTTMGSAVSVLFTSSAKGNSYTWTATGSNVLTGPTYIEVTTDGGSTTTAPLYVTVKYSRTVNS